MKTKRISAGRNSERGLIITLVAVVLLFAVGAMAVLAIDVATFYTARSEAQLAADGVALSAARALANSGMTSNPPPGGDTDLADDAKRIAIILAIQVATQNQVGGRNLVAISNCANEVCITFNDGDANFGTNPRVTVTVTRSDLPTFFARIFGTRLIAVQATAVAEAYNPSGVNVAAGGATPVAPLCVKPWVLPNLSPLSTPTNPIPIFDVTTGAIQNASSLLGWEDTAPTPLFKAACQNSGPGPACLPSWPPPTRWNYYPGTTSGSTPSFPAPTQALPDCSFGTLTAYQATIAGCVTTPIACNSIVTLDQTDPNRRNRPTAEAVNCLTHTENDQGDQVTVSPPNKSFQFLAGADNPIPGLAGKNVLVSDSLVTVPVFDGAISASSSVQVIGFVQLFMNWDGNHTSPGPPARSIKTAIVNLVGCGTSATGNPIYGNGPSAVAVRLIHQ